MPNYSASKLSLFEQCPRRYFYRHVAGLPGEPSVQHPATFMGSRVHDALEFLYGEVKAGRLPTSDDLIAWFRMRWAEKWSTEPPAVPAWDSAERWLSIGESCLTRYYAQHHPFSADETLGLERFVEFPLDAEGTIRFRGFIDRLARTPDGTIRVHDYKTQDSVPDQAEVDALDQMTFYELAIRHELNHSGPVELVWHFVRAGVARTSRRTPEQLASVRSDAISLVRDIESRAAQEDRFEPKPSRLCQWCEHRKRCPASAGTGATP
jgi:putative RecB family exonuclease